MTQASNADPGAATTPTGNPTVVLPAAGGKSSDLRLVTAAVARDT